MVVLTYREGHFLQATFSVGEPFGPTFVRTVRPNPISGLFGSVSKKDLTNIFSNCNMTES